MGDMVEDKAELARVREEAKSVWEESNALTEVQRQLFVSTWEERREDYDSLLENHSISMLSLHDANTVVSERLTYGYGMIIEPQSLTSVERLAKIDLEVGLLAVALGEPRESSVMKEYHKHLLEERLIQLRGKK